MWQGTNLLSHTGSRHLSSQWLLPYLCQDVGLLNQAKQPCPLGTSSVRGGWQESKTSALQGTDVQGGWRHRMRTAWRPNKAMAVGSPHFETGPSLVASLGFSSARYAHANEAESIDCCP